MASVNVLDEWESDQVGTSTIEGTAGDLAGLLLDDSQDDFPGSPTSPQKQGPCALEPLERSVARGRGRVGAIAAASECLLIATSRAALLRYDLSAGQMPVTELELSRAADVRAAGMWVDPTAMHALISVEVGNTLGSSTEVHYVHARWKKSRTLSKLKQKGTRITAVAWHHAQLSEASTGPVILGTDTGKLLEVVLDEKDKRDAPVRQLYDFEDALEPIRGLEHQALQGDKSLVLVATPTRLYVLVGGPTLEAVFASYPESAADLRNCLHVPSEASAFAGMLQTWAPLGSRKAALFSWLTPAGVQHGKLLLGRDKRPATDLEFLDLGRPISVPEAMSEGVLSMVMTQFHVLLLTSCTVHVTSLISGHTVQEVALLPYLRQLPAVPFLSMVRDPEAAAIYLVAGVGLFEVLMDNEERDLWRSFLERGDYASASRYASTQAERNEVSRAEADVAFQEGRYVHAAQLWGRIRSAEPSFEEVALRFVGAAATDALQEFLLARLQVLSPEDKAQATMVASWVVELYLDHINRAMLEETPEASTSGQQHEQALRDFLRDHVDVLDVNVTIGLLASYGRLDDLMHYATYRQDNETVLEYLLQRGDVAKALAVLRLPNVSQELAYKFAPALLAAMPSDTIDAWMAASPPLDPRRLLPALMRIAEGSAPSAAAPSSLQEEALRYVEYCIHKLGSTDSAVHNLAVSLYCWDKDERRLLEYLQSARDSLGKPWYEPQFALRVARQHGRLNACVRLLCELGLHEDAVALALTFDRTLATAVAARVEDDEALKRKLWLAIAQNLINASSADDDADPRERVAAVVEVLEEADGCIRIEDVLPLFPDFVTIDAFKAAICASLEDYNSHIERLKFEMSDATRMADALRRDMAALEGQAGTLNLSEPCARCGSAIGAAAGASAAPAGGAMPRYYLFPTGNAFHGSCLAAEVIELAGPQQRSHILSLCNRLSQMSAESALLSNGKGPPEAEKLLQNLESHIAVEDPYNGEAVVRNISKDFIDPNDAELESWHF